MPDFQGQLALSDSDARREQVEANAATDWVSCHTLNSTRTGSYRRTEVLLFDRAFVNEPTFTTGGGYVGKFTPVLPSSTTTGGGDGGDTPTTSALDRSNQVDIAHGMMNNDEYVTSRYDLRITGTWGSTDPLTVLATFLRYNTPGSTSGSFTLRAEVYIGNSQDIAFAEEAPLDAGSSGQMRFSPPLGWSRVRVTVRSAWRGWMLIADYSAPTRSLARTASTLLPWIQTVTMPNGYVSGTVASNSSRTYSVTVRGPAVGQAGRVTFLMEFVRAQHPTLLGNDMRIAWWAGDQLQPNRNVVGGGTLVGNNGWIGFLDVDAGWDRITLRYDYVEAASGAQEPERSIAQIVAGGSGGGGDDGGGDDGGAGTTTTTVKTEQVSGHKDPIVSAVVTEWLRDGLLYAGARVATMVFYPGTETTTKKTFASGGGGGPVITDPGQATLSAPWLREVARTADQTINELDDSKWVSTNSNGKFLQVVPDTSGHSAIMLYNSYTGGGEGQGMKAASILGRFDLDAVQDNPEPRFTRADDGRWDLQFILRGTYTEYARDVSASLAAWFNTVAQVGVINGNVMRGQGDIVNLGTDGRQYLTVKMTGISLAGVDDGFSENTFTVQAGSYSESAVFSGLGPLLNILPVGVRVIAKGRFVLDDDVKGIETTTTRDVAIGGTGTWRHWLEFSGMAVARTGRSVAVEAAKDLPSRAPGVGEMTSYVT